jgi:hypothetical protein
LKAIRRRTDENVVVLFFLLLVTMVRGYSSITASTISPMFMTLALLTQALTQTLGECFSRSLFPHSSLFPPSGFPVRRWPATVAIEKTMTYHRGQ